MKASAIIDLYELLIDGTNTLTYTEETALLNRAYQKICRDRPWEFLKTSATGSITSGTPPYISIPSDFGYLIENYQSTDISIGQNNSAPKVIFVGSSYSPYKVVNFSDRRQYRNNNGYAYFDYVNSKIYFTDNTPSGTYEFDYIKTATSLTSTPVESVTDTEPLFPADFHPMIAYAMAMDDYIIKQYEKAKSYAPENKAVFDGYMRDLAYYNSMLRAN